MPNLTLDVGCSIQRWCDIRLDLNRRVRPTVIGDAEHLPFKADAFVAVRLSNVLEHLEHPQKALDDAKRVGFIVYALYPTHWDRVPHILQVFTSLNLRLLWGFIRVEWRMPNHRHRWLLQPFGTWRVVKMPIPKWGRFALFQMDATYECSWSRLGK